MAVQECVYWGLSMAEMMLPPLLLVDSNALIKTLREFAPTALQSFFVTCLIAFCLGHRSPGEIEVKSEGASYVSDGSTLGSLIMLCLLVSHFGFQILPTGPLTLNREAMQQVAADSRTWSSWPNRHDCPMIAI